ncbi:MAG: hypothetical protein R3Y07_07860 [Eubacteriales bacterium]
MEKVNWEVLATIFSALSAIMIVVLTISNQKNMKKERILNLYEKYHSPEFYGKIRAPFYEIGEKWKESIEGDEVYAKAVIGADNLNKEFRPLPEMPFCIDKEQEHVLEPITFVGLTEHQILTVGLGFWSTLNILSVEKCVDIQLLKIFEESYNYDKSFIQSLRLRVEYEFNSGNIKELPKWVENTKELEDIFDKLTVKANKKKERKRNPQNFFRGFR